MADLPPLEQRTLLRTLKNLPGSIFEEVRVVLGIPAHGLPSGGSLGDRATALLEWSNSDVGCGAKVLKETVDGIVADYKWTPPSDEDSDEAAETTAVSSNQPSPSPANSSKSSVLRDQVFVSYSHNDSEWLKKLQVNLKPYIRKGIKLWDDTQILPGAKWRDEINNALARAKVAVLLVSADFLNSDFIDEKELPQLLAAAENEGVKVIWVPIRPSAFQATDIEQYQAVHPPVKPLSILDDSEQELALVNIAKAIWDAFQS